MKNKIILISALLYLCTKLNAQTIRYDSLQCGEIRLAYAQSPSKPDIKPVKIKLWANTAAISAKGYKITNGKISALAGMAISGAVDGIVEGYEFDGRKSFERKYNVSPTGYFGSESWRRAYKNNDPERGDKNLYSRTFGAWDFYHNADDARKVGYISSGAIIGISGNQINKKWWHYLVDAGLGFAVSGAAKAVGMYWVRN